MKRLLSIYLAAWSAGIIAGDLCVLLHVSPNCAAVIIMGGVVAGGAAQRKLNLPIRAIACVLALACLLFGTTMFFRREHFRANLHAYFDRQNAVHQECDDQRSREPRPMP